MGDAGIGVFRNAVNEIAGIAGIEGFWSRKHYFFTPWGRLLAKKMAHFFATFFFPLFGRRFWRLKGEKGGAPPIDFFPGVLGGLFVKNRLFFLLFFRWFRIYFCIFFNIKERSK